MFLLCLSAFDLPEGSNASSRRLLRDLSCFTDPCPLEQPSVVIDSLRPHLPPSHRYLHPSLQHVHRLRSTHPNAKLSNQFRRVRSLTLSLASHPLLRRRESRVSAHLLRTNEPTHPLPHLSTTAPSFGRPELDAVPEVVEGELERVQVEVRDRSERGDVEAEQKNRLWCWCRGRGRRSWGSGRGNGRERVDGEDGEGQG